MAFPTFSRIQNCCYFNKKFADVFVISLGNSFDHLQAAVMFRTTLFCHSLSLQIYRFCKAASHEGERGWKQSGAQREQQRFGCGHFLGISSTVDLCRFCVLSLYRRRVFDNTHGKDNSAFR